jgi:hypothetical protein
LDLCGRKGLAAARGKHYAEVKPLHPRGGDLKLRLDALDILAGGALQLFLKRHTPLAFELGKLTCKEIEHRVLSQQLQFSLPVWPREAVTLQTPHCGLFRSEISCGIARHHFGIRQPDAFSRI